MLEFKTIEILRSNTEIVKLIKGYHYQIKNGEIKTLLHTNLQFIKPTTYLITYHTTLTLLEYKVNEISNKPFYIKEYNQKYNLKEIIQILRNL